MHLSITLLTEVFDIKNLKILSNVYISNFCKL